MTLQQLYDELDECDDVWEVAGTLSKANHYARRNGLGHLAQDAPYGMCSIEDAQRIIGAMMRWERDHAEALTVAQAAEILGVSPDTVYDLCRDGRLRHTKAGRVIRIMRSDLHQIATDGW